MVALTVWYRVLNKISTMNKQFQRNDMDFSMACRLTETAAATFHNYHETGFDIALDKAKEMTPHLDLE